MPRGIVKTKKVRSHKFVGEEDAAIVTDYLNVSGRNLDDPVMVLVELTHQFEAGQLWKGQGIVEHINRTISDYKLGRAEVHSFSTQDGFTFNENFLGDSQNAALSLAFTRAVNLHKQSLLERVRLCAKRDCGRWFFAVLPQQSFHSDDCRTQTTSQNPKFRERRKRYMRHRRKKHKKGAKP